MKHLKQNATAILLALVLCFAFWYFVFAQITKPKREETLSIFVTCETCDDNNLLERVSGIELKNKELHTASPRSEYYDSVLQTIGIISSDVMIVQTSLFENSATFTSFVPINVALDSKYVTIDNGGYAYAIVVYDGTTNLLEGICTFSSPVCIGVNSASPHVEKSIEALLSLLNING